MRKAMAVLTFSAIAFLIAVILFFNRSVDLKPGAPSDYLGQSQIELYKAYLSGEEELFFLDMAAEQAFGKAGHLEKLKENRQEFLKAFSKEFAKYLPEFNKNFPAANLNIEDYTFKTDSRGLIGISDKEITMPAKYHEYTFIPNFRVFVGTGETGETSYKAVAADAQAEQTAAEEPAAQAREPVTENTAEAPQEEPVPLGAE
ncbi:MAG: hypothetical protein QME12_06025 [Nanoarchaeota archaeon]|nr:hypothetical protein [Nanoarchaeota archaeon]